MINALKNSSLLKRFRDDARGAMTVMWGISITGIILATGAAYDYSQLTTTKQKAQSIADTVGLSAAVYIKAQGNSTNRAPQSFQEGWVDGQEVFLSDTDFDLGGAVFEGNKFNPTTIKVDYDFTNGTATTTVKGFTRPAFMQFAGFKRLPFESTSTVQFERQDVGDPASVYLVLDVSGSMGWQESRNSESRMDAMQQAASNFLVQLGEIENSTNDGDPSTTDRRILRMGMSAYSRECVGQYFCPFIEPDGHIPVWTDAMDWGALDETKITRLHPLGGTNSTGSVEQAYLQMQDETNAHLDEANAHPDPNTNLPPMINPLRYVVFMTDGQNQQNRQVCQEEDVMPYTRWVGNQRFNFGFTRTSPPPRRWRFAYNQEAVTTEIVCRDVATNYDQNTLRSCERMKNLGIEVYTIGFALNPGTYYSPRDGFLQVRENDVALARSVLKNCASSDKHFIQAENGSDLREAFESIGKNIVEDTIRITG